MNHSGDQHEPADRGHACAAWWRLPLLLAVVLAAIIVYGGGAPDAMAPSDSPSEIAGEKGGPTSFAPAESIRAGQTVLLAIDFGNGIVKNLPPITWREGMTALDMLTMASRDGAVAFKTHGAGAMAFLSDLGGVANEGARGRNWIYSVNGDSADRSFAVYELRPGDRVLWSFATAE